MRSILFSIAALLAPAAYAAAGMELVTPRSISVAGGESATVSVRLYDVAGRGVAGESVTFSNDACGFFQGGGFFGNAVSDANGVASIRFTASNPPGITCWIQAAANGPHATIDVLTYSVNGVRIVTTITPEKTHPGERYVLSVAPTYGLYELRDVDVSARVVNGSGTATLSQLSGSTGQKGYVDFEVTPGGNGEYMIESAFRSQKSVVVSGGPEATLQDLWWAGSAENGWGVSIVQHREMLFAVIYAYDDAGKPTWFMVPGGSWNAARTEFTGLAFVPTGAPFYAYDAAKLLVGPAVGTVKLTFSGTDHATLDYTFNNKAGRKSLVRNAFGPPDFTSPAGVGDMWWGGAAQNGWGIALLQQFRTLFTVWFTYDATGAPTWYFMPGGKWTDASTYEGRVYRASSSPWLGVPYDASKFKSVDVGSFKLRLAGDSAAFDYTVEGRTGSIPLSRYAF